MAAALAADGGEADAARGGRRGHSEGGGGTGALRNQVDTAAGY